jgi:predicted metal-dependent hydrolase
MEIAYELRTSARARAMRVEVHPDARVVVTVPRWFSSSGVERFIAKHARWIERALARTRGKRVIRFSRGDIDALKKEALAIAQARCAQVARVYGVHYKKISIRAQKSRWGSCSQKGTLSFNYKIAALPAHVCDYIIVHEICHLLEMNHSKKFWQQVARMVPEHQKIRKELRDTLIVFQ